MTPKELSDLYFSRVAPMNEYFSAILHDPTQNIQLRKNASDYLGCIQSIYGKKYNDGRYCFVVLLELWDNGLREVKKERRWTYLVDNIGTKFTLHRLFEEGFIYALNAYEARNE